MTGPDDVEVLISVRFCLFLVEQAHFGPDYRTFGYFRLVLLVGRRSLVERFVSNRPKEGLQKVCYRHRA